MPKLGISIVNFNTGEFLIKCLECLKNVSDEVDLDIWVVDNASVDDSLIKAKRKFPNIHYIENKENLGFGKAHNQVLEKINAEFILVLNPDTEIGKGVLPYMINFMENHSEVGAASCQVLLADGSLDWAAHRGFPVPLAAFLYFLGNETFYHLTKRRMEKTHEVDSISGAFLLTRRSVLDKVGLFDNDYFMYAEDIDLCFRIKEAGFKIMYVSEVSIIHFKGISSGIKKHSSEMTTASFETRLKTLNAFYESMIIFYKKHLAEKYPFFINWLVYLGINLKWALAKRKLNV